MGIRSWQQKMHITQPGRKLSMEIAVSKAIAKKLRLLLNSNPTSKGIINN